MGSGFFIRLPGPFGKNVIWYFEREAEVAKQGKDLTDFTIEGARILSDDEAYFPRPSSDGNFIVYQRNNERKKEIVLPDRLEGSKNILTEGMSPSLSFDETKIAFTAKKDGNWTELTATSSSTDVDFYSPQFSGETIYNQKELASFIGNPRSSFGTISHEGKVYMAGRHQGAEHTYPPESFSDVVIAYDIANNSWAELAPRPAKDHGYQIVAFRNYIYALKLDEMKWRHSGRYLKETKGFFQVFPVDNKSLGMLVRHHYDQGEDRPVSTFETIYK
jgi:hypothetical protein